MQRCVIAGDDFVVKLLIRYNGIGKDLTPDEKEILLFALYNESVTNRGLALRAEQEWRKE